ncbi:MAG: response regulator [Aulosira sp. DedQUE10]|nr:response regulator [Aulosira sp. DedQUE10]
MSQQQRTVLIVDDSPEDCELYRQYLLQDREYQYTVVVAQLGQEGLVLWQLHQLDIVLLDYRLPDLDGLEFLSQLQIMTRQSFLPVIVITGVGNEAIAVQAMKAGAQNYLVKGGITAEELRLAVNGAIENLQLRTEIQQHIEKERLISQITRQIFKSLNLNEILQTTVSEVRQFLHTDRVLIFQLYSDGSGQVVAESVGEQWPSVLASIISDPRFAEDYIERYCQGLLNQDPSSVEDYIERYRQGLVTATADIYDGSIDPVHVELLSQLQIRANLVVPILHEQYFWGMLIAHHCTVPREWQPIEIELLQELANHVSLAIRQAQTLQQVQNELAERKRTEAILQENEEKLRVALEAARMGTWDLNILTSQIQWSANLEALFGFEPGEFDGSLAMFFSRVHLDDRDRVQEAINAAVTTGANYYIEFRVVYPDGTIRWALSQGKVFYDESGQPVRMAGVDLDISDRKRAESELRQSEEFNQRMLASSSDCIKVLDLDSRILYMNPGGINLLEIDDFTTLLNTEWICLWENEARQEAEAAIAVAKAGELGRFQGYCPTATGKPKWWDVVLTPIRNPSGQILQLLCISRDITDYKQAEEAIRQSEVRYRYLAEAIPHLVWTCDANCICDYVNERLCEYTGLTFEQALGFGWLSAVHPDDVESNQTFWVDAVKNSAFYKHEYRFRRNSDGSYRWHLILGLPLKDQQGRVVKWFGTCTDIHDQKQLEIERDRILQLEQVARNEAERANRIKDEFLAILSHELRSPLNPILGWTKLLQSRKLEPSKTAEALATIERNAKLQTQLIDDLLDIARILRGKLSLNADTVNLTFVIEAAIDTVRTAAVAKSILIHPVLRNIGQVSGDAVRLQQVVWNLLSNAIKFTPTGGRVEIWLERLGDQAQITVTDTGKGINPDFLPYIFESFRQEDVSITRKYGGLGLGLAIVRHIIEAHGGTVAVDSPGEGQGSTFTVSLPLLNIEPESDRPEELSTDELDLTGVKILTIDDEPDSRDFLTVLLAYYGAEVMTVASSSEFLAAIESFGPDVLVSDIGMPEVDGYTLLRQVRSLPPERGGKIPAIALTAYAGEINQQQALAAGFQRHLSKPIDPDLLVQAVAQLIREN